MGFIWHYHVTWFDSNGLSWGHSFSSFKEALGYYRNAHHPEGTHDLQLDSDNGLTAEEQAQL